MLRLLTGWRAAWQHPLAAVYREQPAYVLSPRLARLAVRLIWGLLLVGTALAVVAYPQAADADCSFVTAYGCLYPMVNGNNPLDGFNTWLGRIVTIGLLAAPFILLIAAIGRNFVRGLRGTWTSGPKGTTIAASWPNRTIDLLALTPVCPTELVRIRLLDRLYRLWQQRAWLLMAAGTVAAITISNDVMAPTFWWLGRWGSWLVQLGLALTWLLTAALVLTAFGAFALLNEVTFSAGEGQHPLNWSLIALALFVVMIVSPLFVGIGLGQFIPHTSFDRDRAVWAILLPASLAASGAICTIVNYLAAQGVFSLRLWFRQR